MCNRIIRLLASFWISFLVISLDFPFHAAQAQIFPVSEERMALDHLEGWEFEKGDWIEADISANTLQFVRENGHTGSQKIRIGSGINNGKKISYLGLYYDPKTPVKTWEIRSKHQQNWWAIFGSREAKEQLFLRLYEVKGQARIYTRYGIHTTPEIDTIIEKQGGFGSWGCLLARYELLKQIEKLYELNEGVVKVVTINATLFQQ